MNSDSLVICPVYNEQETIDEFYQRLRQNYSGDVLLVDDGSTDRSKEFFKKIQTANTFIKYHIERFGYGTALILGFRFALERGYKRIVTMDVDLQHNPEQISFFLKELREWSVVLGSRYIRIAKLLDIPPERLVINRYISKLIKSLFSLEFTDPFCGLRGYQNSFLEKVNLREKSYGITLEILLEIIKTKAHFREIPIEAIYFKDSRKFLDGLNDPRRRLLYYLEVLSRKRKELADEKKVFICKSSS